MTQPCPCGTDGRHWHRVDGKDLCLCGRCNAVLHIIVDNVQGLPADQVILMDAPDPEDQTTYIDRMASADPKDYRPQESVLTRQVAESTKAWEAVEESEDSDDDDVLRGFFVPLRDDHNDVYRRVPQDGGN